LFGLLSEFVPLGGYRRKSYLVLATLLGMIAFLALILSPISAASEGRLIWWLILAAVSVVCADVVTDAMMIETSRPLIEAARHRVGGGAHFQFQ
jgi:MFS-type transporter involved in bile tolerance (Atg22 family)